MLTRKEMSGGGIDPATFGAKVECVASELLRHLCSSSFICLVMSVITSSYLVLHCKRTALSGDRSRDLRFPSPEGSHGAIEAVGCRSLYCDLVSLLIVEPILVLSQ